MSDVLRSVISSVLLAAAAGVSVTSLAADSGEPRALSPALASIQAWIEFRDEIRSEAASLKGRVATHNAQCATVPAENAPLVAQCQQAQIELKAAVAAYEAHRAAYQRSLDWYLAAPVVARSDLTPEVRSAIDDLQSLALGQDWPAEKRARFAAALLGLEVTPDDQQPAREHTELPWHAIAARPISADLKAAAEAASGSSVFTASSGQQLGNSDCAVFALANASGKPYSVVAAAAADAVARDPLRSVAERKDPQGVLSKTGLNGGELVFLTEKLGQVSIVRPGSFTHTLAGGEAVMVNVGGHEVVMTKSFEYGGKTWFEVMDSQKNTTQRVYLTAAELNAKIKENGIVYHAEPGMTVPLLR